MPGIKLSRRRTLLFATLTIVTGIITISACSSEENPPVGSLAVAVAPTSINVAPGGTGSATATVTRSGSFTGAVTLTQSGAPSGVTVTFAPAEVPGSSTTSTVNVAVGGTVPAGTHAITISAEGASVTTATATLTVVVVGAEAGAISLAANPTTLAVTAGAAAVTSTITITRTAPFAGAVGLTVSGAPAGVTATMNPVSATGATSTLSVSATASAVSGTYPLIVHGVGTGIADATVTVNATVSASGGGGSFSVTFCAADAPIWVAQQDGSGAWAQVAASSGTTYPFSFASGRGGIAFVVPETTPTASTDLNIVYGTAAEFTALGGNANLTDCSAKTVNGTVANVNVTELALISLGFAQATTGPALPGYPAFVLDDVADGAQDLVASRIDPTTFLANKVIIRRAQNIAAGGNLALLDFNNAAEAFAPGTANVTVAGLGADQAVVLSAFTGVYGSRTNATVSLINGYTSGAQPYAAVPLAQLTNPLELNQLSAFAEDASNANAVRFAGIYFRAPAAQTVTMGAVMSTPTVTKLVTGAIARPQVQLASQADYNRLLSASYHQGDVRFVNVFATADYFGGLPTNWDVTVPDLSGANGWTPAWGLQDGTAIDWDVTVQGGAIQFLDYNSIAAGATFKSATVSAATPLAIRAARSGADAFAMQRRLTDLLRRQQENPLH